MSDLKKLLRRLGISTKEDAVALFWQFFKFGLVGVSNTLVSQAVYYVFIFIRGGTLMAMLGQSAGWFIGVANAFIWNRKFVFKESDEVWWKALVKMYAAYSLSFVVTLALTFVLIEWLSVDVWIAPIPILLVTVPLNFITSKYWSFRAASKSKPEKGG